MFDHGGEQVIDTTCSKLLYGHKREPNERQGLAKDPALVLWGGLELLPLGFRLGPAHGGRKQTHLPHPQGVPLQNCYKGVCDEREMF